jgi:hypothetical protein
MSWHFSRALVAAYSEATCSGGAQSVLSSMNPTPALYSYSDKMMAFCRRSQSGMTCEPLTETLGAELLTWYLAGFPARTLAAQERVQESPGSDQDCGAKWPGSLARYDRDTHSWKTAQYSLLGDLAEFSETWPRWGTMRNGVCWERQTLERRTDEIESGCWLSTPTKSMSQRSAEFAEGRLPTPAEFVEKYPTPTKSDATRSGTSMRKDNNLLEGGLHGVSLHHYVAMWPTPTKHDAKDTGTAPSEGERNTPCLSYQAGGKLNPPWVEWLMGWPIGWTDLVPLATGRFQQWQQQHLLSL